MKRDAPSKITRELMGPDRSVRRGLKTYEDGSHDSRNPRFEREKKKRFRRTIAPGYGQRQYRA